MNGKIRGKIQVGALPTIAPYFLPGMVRPFHEKYPGAELIIHEDTTSQLLRNLEQNQLDLAVISDGSPGPGIQVEDLFSEELLLCLPLNHALTKRRKIVAADLPSEKFIVMQEGHCLGAQAQQFCQSKGFRPQVSCRSAQIGTVLAMVRAGLGISLIPEMARRSEPADGVVYRSLDGVRPHRTIALAISKHRKTGRSTLELGKFIRQNLVTAR